MKITLDRSFAAISLLLLAPLLGVLALLIRITMGKPVLFRQQRPGYRGKIFTLYKFRTMTSEVDPAGNLLPDDQRLTLLGHFIRKTSLDELPQLINILQGDLSLVGPRPLLPEYQGLYSSEQMRRHDVLPGVTGWAQIHGRNAIDWETRLTLDVWYVDHWSLALDCRIIAATILSVAGGRGVSHPGHKTMPRFTGSSRFREHQ